MCTPAARLLPRLRARRKNFPVFPRKFSHPREKSDLDGSRHRTPPSRPSSVLSQLCPPRVRSSLKSSPARVNKRGGGGAPGVGLVTRFPPLSSYSLLLLPPLLLLPLFLSCFQSFGISPAAPTPSHLPLSHSPSPAATLTLLGSGKEGKGAPALTSSSTISGNPTL